jgi:hypothetical protein
MGVTLAIVLTTHGAAHAASPAERACKTTCGSAQKTCVEGARTTFDAAAALCPSRGPEKKACLVQPKRVYAGAKRVCRAFKKSCIDCCKRGGTDCAEPPEPLLASGSFDVPPRLRAESILLPPAPSGRGFLLLRLPDGEIVVDPSKRTPVSAAAECATAVLSCYAEGQRNFPGCLAAVPPCTSKTPWRSDKPVCCPKACVERYQELRRAGRGEAAAFAAAIWEAPSCMPGLAGHAPEVKP